MALKITLHWQALKIFDPQPNTRLSSRSIEISLAPVTLINSIKWCEENQKPKRGEKRRRKKNSRKKGQLNILKINWSTDVIEAVLTFSVFFFHIFVGRHRQYSSTAIEMVVGSLAEHVIFLLATTLLSIADWSPNTTQEINVSFHDWRLT